MFNFDKKVVIIILMSCSLGNIVNSITGNFIKISPDNFLQNKPYCFLLKNEKCKVRKVIVDNDYITFPCKSKVGKCVGSCNDVNNPYLKFVYSMLLKTSVESLLT